MYNVRKIIYRYYQLKHYKAMNKKCKICSATLEYHKEGLCEDCKLKEHVNFCSSESPCEMCQNSLRSSSPNLYYLSYLIT